MAAGFGDTETLRAHRIWSVEVPSSETTRKGAGIASAWLYVWLRNLKSAGKIAVAAIGCRSDPWIATGRRCH